MALASSEAIRAGGAFVELFVDDRKMVAGLSAGGDKLYAFGRNVARVGAMIEGVASAAVGMGAIFVREFGDMEAKVKQLDTVLTSTRHGAGMDRLEFLKMADSLEDVTKFSETTILETENLLLTFLRIGKEIFPEALVAVMDVATALGHSAPDAAIQLGKALNDPRRGMLSLMRIGVSFTETQRDQIKTLMEEGNILEAQKIILEEVAMEFGGSARAAADTFTGSLSRLHNTAEQVMIAMGAQIALALRPYVEWMIRCLHAVERFIYQNPQLVQGLIKMVYWMTMAGAALIALGTGLMMLTSSVFPITVIVMVLLGVLDALGLIDSGIGDVAKSFSIAGQSIQAYWEVLIDSIAKAWLWCEKTLLEGIQIILKELIRASAYYKYLKGEEMSPEEVEVFTGYKIQRAVYKGKPVEPTTGVAGWAASLDKTIEERQRITRKSMEDLTQHSADVLTQDWYEQQRRKNPPFDWRQLPVPQWPYVPPRSAYGPNVPTRPIEAIGAFGSIAEMMGAKAGDPLIRAAQQQVELLKGMKMSLDNIEQNTRDMELVYG